MQRKEDSAAHPRYVSVYMSRKSSTNPWRCITLISLRLLYNLEVISAMPMFSHTPSVELTMHSISEDTVSTASRKDRTISRYAKEAESSQKSTTTSLLAILAATNKLKRDTYFVWADPLDYVDRVGLQPGYSIIGPGIVRGPAPKGGKKWELPDGKKERLSGEEHPDTHIEAGTGATLQHFPDHFPKELLYGGTLEADQLVKDARCEAFLLKTQS